jgi:hypothetical protein
VLLDVDNLISYMLLHYYTGDADAPLSNFLKMDKGNNWRCLRRRGADHGYRCFVHDGEHTLLAPSWNPNRALARVTGANRGDFAFSNPEWLNADLSSNPEHRVRMGDLAHRFLFNGGPMTPEAARALFDRRVAEVEPVIVADICRWGSNPATHTLARWRANIEAVRTRFFPTRPAVLLQHLRTTGVYPMVAAPVFSPHGGKVAPGFSLTMTGGPEVLFTTDGSDPRAIGGGISPTARPYGGALSISRATTVKARARAGGEWSALTEAHFAP